jgi:CDP-4-dehydro-6-deoxyglucose reductase, E1
MAVRVLVVGASGLVGGGMHRALERVGAQVVGTYHSRPGPGLRPLDVRDAAATALLVAEVRPEIVVLAVEPSGGRAACEADPALAAAVHVGGTANVLAAASAAGARVAYFSADRVFDGLPEDAAADEDREPCPQSGYGRVKAEAERLLSGAATPHLIVRSSDVFGWDRASSNLAMRVWTELQAHAPLPVPEHAWVVPTMVEYLAEASTRLLEAGVRGVVHVVGRDRVPVGDFAATLARTMALDVKLIHRNGSTRSAAAGGGGRRLTSTRTSALLGTDPIDLRDAMGRFRRQWRADTHVRGGPREASAEAVELRKSILEQVRRYHALAHRREPFVPYKSRVQYAGRVFGEEEVVNLVDSALDFWLTLGPYGELFEQRMRLFYGAKDFVLVNSGSTANLTAVMSLMSKQVPEPLRPGDEVITPALTFPTTLTPLIHGGLVPVFVDCELDTYNVDPALLADAIGPRTRAIMVPHTLGNPCDMDVICELVERHGLYLVEDSCDALGSTFRGRTVGTFGDLATLSFYPAHHITLGEGGGVIVNRPGLSRIVRSVRDWGRDCWCGPGECNTCGKRFGWQMGGLPKGYDHKYIYSNFGYNFKPTDMQAAVGLAQADRIPDFAARRKANFRRLRAGLERYADRLILPRLDVRADPSWFGFPITVEAGVSRTALVQWLENANVETRQVFGGSILRQPAFQDITCRIAATLERTDRVMRDTCFIGVYPGLDEAMIDFILTVFDDFFAKAGRAA